MNAVSRQTALYPVVSEGGVRHLRHELRPFS